MGAGCPILSESKGWDNPGRCRSLKRYQNPGQLHFVAFICFRRMPFLRATGKRNLFLGTLEGTRKGCALVVVDYVVMRKHLHLLVSELERGSLATAIQLLQQTSSRGKLGAPLFAARVGFIVGAGQFAATVLAARLVVWNL